MKEQKQGGIGSFRAVGPDGKPSPKPHHGWPHARNTKEQHCEKRLRARIKDWDNTVNDAYNRSPAGGIDRRVESGGYHKPGRVKS